MDNAGAFREHYNRGRLLRRSVLIEIMVLQVVDFGPSNFSLSYIVWLWTMFGIFFSIIYFRNKPKRPDGTKVDIRGWMFPVGQEQEEQGQQEPVGALLILTVLFASQAAQQAGGGQEREDQDQEMPEPGHSRRGRKRSSWDAIKPLSKKLCTASIEAQVVQLAEERGTQPETILASIMHRWAQTYRIIR